MENNEKLINLISMLKIEGDEGLNSYVDETISAFKCDCKRATIMLLWSIWTSFLYGKIREFGLKNFARFCQEKKIRVEGNIVQIYDLNKIKDRDILFLCRESGFYDTNIENQLINLLNLRNSCSHVAQLNVTEYQLFSYIEQICGYIGIIKKLDYRQVHKSFIEELKSMDKQRVIQVIGSLEFDVLRATLDKCLEEACFITNWSEYQSNKGIYHLLSLVSQYREKDEEKVYFFDIIFKKIASEEIRFDLEIIEELSKVLEYTVIKKLVLAKGYLDALIKLFIKSGSFNTAKLNARSLLIFKKDFNVEQLKAIANAYLSNRQITESSGAIIALKFIFSENKRNLSEDLIRELDQKGLNL